MADEEEEAGSGVVEEESDAVEAALLEKASARHRLDVVGGRRCDKRRQVCCGARLVAEVQRHARARPTADVRGIRSFCTLLAVKELAWSGQAGVFGESCTRSSSTATQGQRESGEVCARGSVGGQG